MNELILIVVSIVCLGMLFYIGKSLVVYISNELSNTLSAYQEDTTRISKQVFQLQKTVHVQATYIGIEFEKASAHYEQTTAAMLQQTKEIVKSLREIERSTNRQKELEIEIICLKSILHRKEKKMSQNEHKYAYIDIYSDITCSILIRVDKMGFHRRYDFVSLHTDDTAMCGNWSNAVEWSELFNGFCRNALSQNTKYQIADSIVFDYNTDNGLPILRMFIKKQQANTKKYSFSKLECLQIYSKMSKILAKCDLISHGGY